MNRSRGPRNGIKWERRQAPRLVVPEGVTINVRIECDDGTLWPAKCLNIGLAGINVQSPLQHIPIPKAKLGQKVFLTLKLESEVVNKVPGFFGMAPNTGWGFSCLSPPRELPSKKTIFAI